MKNKFLLSITMALIIGLIVFQSCKKDRTTVFVNNNPGGGTVSQFATLASFYKTLKPATQVFQVDAANGGTIVGDRGMKFEFAPGTFRNSSGMAVTGKVKISLVEVTNYAEMMGTGARTEAVDGVLGSAAMFNITATQNGSPVFTASPMIASIPVDQGANLDNIDQFTGIVGLDTATQDTTVKWDSDSFPFYYNADSMKQVYDSIQKEYELKKIVRFNLYVFGWCNLDAYYNNFSGCQVRVTYTGITNILSAEVYMKLNNDGLKGLYQLSYLPSLDEFNSTYYNLPPGWSIHIIVLLKDKNKKVYKEDRIISNSTTINNFSNLKEISDQDLEDFFNNLN